MGGEGHGSFFQQFLFFSPPLTDFAPIWQVCFRAVIFLSRSVHGTSSGARSPRQVLVTWNTLGFGLLYLICGLIAAVVFRKHWLALVLIPLCSTIFGCLLGFCGGALLGMRTPPFASSTASCLICFPHSVSRRPNIHVWAVRDAVVDGPRLGARPVRLLHGPFAYQVRFLRSETLVLNV
jgi:hypothetical protein